MGFKLPPKQITRQNIERVAGAPDRRQFDNFDTTGVFDQGGAAVEEIGDRIMIEADAAFKQDAATRKRMMEADARIKKRNSTIKSSIGMDNYLTESDKRVNTFRVNNDVSDPDNLKRFGQEMRDSADQFHQALLDAGVLPQMAADTYNKALQSNRKLAEALGKDSITNLNKKLQNQIDRKVDDVSAKVKANPASYLEALDALESSLDLFKGELREGQEVAEMEKARDKIARTTIESYMDTGNLVAADDLLNDPYFQRLFLKDEVRVQYEKDIRELEQEEIVRVVDDKTGEIISVPQSKSFGRTLEPAAGSANQKANLFRVAQDLIKNNPKHEDFIKKMFAGSGGDIFNLGETLDTAVVKEKAKNERKTDIPTIRENAQTAFRTKASIARTITVLQEGNFKTGSGSGIRLAIGRLANLFGVTSLLDLDIIGDPAAADTMESASEQMALSMIERLKTGRSSQALIKVVQDSLPGLFRTPEGNMIIARVIDRQADRDIEIADLMETHLADKENNGLLEPGGGKKSFFRKVLELEKNDPIITPELEEAMRETSRTAPRSFKEVIAGHIKTTKTAPFPTTTEEARTFVQGGHHKKLSAEEKQQLKVLLQGQSTSAPEEPPVETIETAPPLVTPPVDSPEVSSATPQAPEIVKPNEETKNSGVDTPALDAVNLALKTGDFSRLSLSILVEALTMMDLNDAQQKLIKTELGVRAGDTPKPKQSTAVPIEPQAIKKSVASPRKAPSPAVPKNHVSESDRAYDEAIQAEKEKFKRELEDVGEIVADFKEIFSGNPSIAAVADSHLAEMTKAMESYDWDAYEDALRSLTEFMEEASERKNPKKKSRKQKKKKK